MINIYYIHLEAYEDSDTIYSSRYNDKIKEFLEEIESQTVKFVFTGEFVVKPSYLESIEDYLNRKEKDYQSKRIDDLCNKIRTELSD